MAAWIRARYALPWVLETPAEVVTEAEQMPRHARYLVPRGLPRRDEVLTVCVGAVVLAHVLFAQLTILLAAAFYLITRATRWRLSWLMVPAAAGLAWTAAIGPRAAAAGFAAGPARIADYLGASGHQASHLLHFTAAFAGLGTWLPRQLPLALVAGAAEAALAGWLTWLHTDEWDLRPARPGLIVAARRAAAVRAIRAGGVVTRDGGSLGVDAGSGARVTLSWAEAAGGISVCGSSGPDVLTTGFQLVHAAVRRRKPVLAVDHTSDPRLARQLADDLLADGIDVAYSYRKRENSHFPHAIANTQLFLDYDNAGREFPYKIVPITVNCYGQHAIARRGGLARFADIHDEQLDPSGPSPARCFAVGAAVARAMRGTGKRVALVASSSWSHAFLNDKDWHLHPDTAADRRLYDAFVRGDYATWTSVTGKEIVAAGQHEMLNWFCLAGAMHELGMRLAWSAFVVTDVFNSNKCFAIFDGKASK